ncbi:MAG: TolC family protein [Paludibacter sp.]|nr:TolC family protein [Paludibacter sp.]
MRVKRILWIPVILLTITLQAQDKPKKWNLSACIDYALNNNIQIQKAKISLEGNQVSTLQAKAQLLPTLSASVNQNAGYSPSGSVGTYSGSYGINSSMTLFNGGQNLKSIQQQKLQEEVGQYSILESEKSIQMSILQIYAQILYADEAVKVYDETVKTSQYQLDRGKKLLRAGSISSADLAQLESQLSSDKYQLIVAQNTLSTAQLEMRQLLELNPEDTINVEIPALTNINILKPVGSLQTIYETALNVIPQIKSTKVDQKVSELETAKAKAAFLPTVSLSGSVSTGHTTNSDYNIGTQLNDALYAGVGVSVNIPIFSNRENKSNLEKARLNEKTVKLETLDTEKSLLKEIESVYQDALSAQSQYVAASEKVKALETSYNLIEQQYTLGMKNTLELLTGKNNLLSARQSMMQAKYLSIMDIQILNLYQDIYPWK